MHKSLLLRPKGLPRNGLVALYLPVVEGQNLLKYSQQFDNAAWTKLRSTVSPNATVAPDGTTTADALVEDTANGAHRIQPSPPSIPQYATMTYSVHLKAGSRSWAALAVYLSGSVQYAFFNLGNGTKGKIRGAGLFNQSIVPIPGATGWYRCSISYVSVATTADVYVHLASNDGFEDFQGDPTTYPNGVYLWGAQLREGTEPGEYYPTTDKQLLMDYSRPRKNLLMPNQANGGEAGTTTDGFTSNGTGTITVTSDTAEHWQGSRSIKCVVDGTAAGQGVASLTTRGLAPEKPYTASVYIKAPVGTDMDVQFLERDEQSTILSTKSINHTATGNWDRVQTSAVFSSAGMAGNIKVIKESGAPTTFYIDGLQLEEGSVATPWEAPPNIGILGSAVGTITNDPTWTGQGLAFETDDYVILPNIPRFETLVVVFYTDGITAATIGQYLIGFAVPESSNFGGIVLGDITGGLTDEIVSVIQSGGTAARTAWCDGAGSIAAGWHTLAVAWNGTTYDLYLDGATKPTISTGTPIALQPVGTISLGRSANAGNYLSGREAAVVAWDRALSTAEVARARAYLKRHLAKFGVVLP